MEVRTEPTKREVTFMLHSNERIIKHKIGLLNLAEELGNVSKACQVMGLSRDTFYRYKSAVETGGVDSLLDRTRRKPNLKNRTDPIVESAILAYALEQPAHGQVRVSDELRKRGVFISPSGVRGIWLRHNLASFKDRLNALEKQVAEKGVVLTEAQVQALERKAQDDVSHGKIETAHPGYLGSQDTFYVGTLEGVGRIYQQTYVDTYSKVAHCKLYTTKTPITAADLLNDHVLPFYEAYGLPVLRVLTDRGTEYCGRAETHDYQLFLAVNDIDHTKTRVKSAQTNGICERFHKTILQDFYQVTFRKKLYADLDTLQADLDEWLVFYNNERTH
jgi:transposase InsO family protein